MLETIVKLLERFVVAHEMIAANSCKPNIADKIKDAIEGGALAEAIKVTAATVKELRVEGEAVIDTPAAEEKPKRKRAAKAEPVPEDDLADEEPEEKKPAKKEVDLTPLRDDIKVMAKHIAAGESDKCADLFDELLEEYGVRTVTKLPDDVVAKFHKDAKALVAKYYDVED